MLKIVKTQKITLGTSAQSVKVNGLAFLLQNLSESATVYFKEKSEDGVNATASNGFAVPAGKMIPQPLVAMELSIVASAASTDVRVMILDFG
jgi:hypothetical protein